MFSVFAGIALYAGLVALCMKFWTWLDRWDEKRKNAAKRRGLR